MKIEVSYAVGYGVELSFEEGAKCSYETGDVKRGKFIAVFSVPPRDAEAMELLSGCPVVLTSSYKELKNTGSKLGKMLGLAGQKAVPQSPLQKALFRASSLYYDAVEAADKHLDSYNELNNYSPNSGEPTVSMEDSQFICDFFWEISEME